MATIFRNKQSIAAYESTNNVKISVFSHKTKPNIFLFSHSTDPNQPAEGLVSQKAIAHLRAGGSKEQLQVCDCDYEAADGSLQTCKMLMMSVASNCGALMFQL